MSGRPSRTVGCWRCGKPIVVRAGCEPIHSDCLVKSWCELIAGIDRLLRENEPSA